MDSLDLVSRIDLAVRQRKHMVEDLARDHDMSLVKMRRVYAGALVLAKKKIGSAIEAAENKGPIGFVDTYIRQTRIAAAYIDRFYAR